MKSNRDGIGAVVRVESALGKQWRMVHSESTSCSQSDIALTFGLGADTRVSAIEVEWPNSGRLRITNVPVNRRVVIVEGKGMEASATLNE